MSSHRSIRCAAALTFLLVFAMTTPDTLAQEAITVCPVNVQEFILRNRDLLPPTNIRATSEDSNNNPAAGFIETTSAPWCTAENQGAPDHEQIYVELAFTEKIVVEFLESTGLLHSWVSNFSIQYSQSESGDDFETYGVLETSQSFIIENILTSPGYFSLERPIVAQRLRLVINDGTVDTFGRLCWEVEIFGCSFNRARQMIYHPSEGTTPPHAPVTTATQSLPPAPNTPANCPPTSSEAVLPSSQKQQEILLIVLPVALATVVIILIIAIVSILVCVCATRRSTKEKPITDQSANNPCFLYDCPRPVAYDVPRASIRSRGGSFASSNDTLHTALSNNEVKNPIYVTKQGSNIPVAPHPFASLTNQVESSTTNDYEMITDNVATMDNRFYEMKRSNSQQSGTARPELPAARTNSVDQRSSSYYAKIPGSDSVPKTDSTSTVETNQTVIQTDIIGEGSANVPPSVKAHGYAKVHKPSNSQAKVGPDVVTSIAGTNQTTL